MSAEEFYAHNRRNQSGRWGSFFALLGFVMIVGVYGLSIQPATHAPTTPDQVPAAASAQHA